MTGHTPGPWTAQGIVVLACTDTADRVIADANMCDPPQEARANARLIAAAPEMYELLKAYHEAERLTGFDLGMLDAATGELLKKVEP